MLLASPTECSVPYATLISRTESAYVSATDALPRRPPPLFQQDVDMTRRTSWFRSARLRRKQLAAHRGERSLAVNSRLRNRRLQVEKLEDRTLLAVIASDGFETGNFSGGTGWASGAWTVAGDATVLSSSSPHSGTYEARLRSSTGDLQRSVNIAGLTEVKLQFWSKVNSFEGSDQALVRVSPDGTNWTTLQTFTSAQSDNVYHFYNLSVSIPSNTLFVRFDAAMNATNDQWYIDDVQVTHTPPPVPGLVSWWTGDNTTADNAGSNDGTLVSGTTFATGQVGQAFNFDGIDDRVGVADSTSLKLTQSLSIEAWVQADSITPSGGVILFRGDDRGGLDPYSLSTTSNGSLQFQVSSLTTGASLTTAMPLGQFVHVAGTLDDATGQMSLYINGVLMSQTVTTVRPFGDLDAASNPAIGIGNHGGYPTTPHNFPFDGLIDELKVYNIPLTASEVLANFNAGKGSLQPVISINDATTTEGNQTIKYLGNFVSALEGGIDDPDMMIYGSDGNVYVSTLSSNGVLRYDATGMPLPATGKPGAEFVSPGAGGLNSARSIAFGPDGKLYVASSNTDEILRFDGATGEPVGDGKFITAGIGGLDQPRGLLFHTDGYLYVTSVGGTTLAAGQDSILRYDAATGLPAGISGVPDDAVFIASGTGGLDNPSQIVFHNDSFYVASTSPSTSNSVLHFATDGSFLGAFVPTGSGGLAGPVELVFRDGFLYVTSWTNNKVLRYDGTTGAFVDEVVNGGGLARPMGLLFEPSGSFLLASGDGDEIRRYGASSAAVFNVRLSAPFPTTVSVNYSSASGTALEGSDYNQVAGMLTFAPGQWNKTVSVPTLDDLVIESTESYFVNLSNPVGAAFGDSQGLGTILDNDSPASATKFYVVDSVADRTFEYGTAGQTLAGDDWALAAANTNARGATSNATGSRLWVVDSAGKVYVYDNNGNSLGTWTAGGVRQAEGITTDGVNIWIVDARDNRTLYYADAAQATTGTIQPTSTFTLAGVNDHPTGIATDGTYIWINDDDKTNEDNIWRYTLAGQFQGGWDLPSPNTKAAGITIDPTHASDSIWVVDSGTDKVYEYKGIFQTTFTTLTLVNTFSLASGNTNPTDIADPPVSGSLGASLEDASTSEVAIAPVLATYPVVSAAGQVLSLTGGQDEQDALALYLNDVGNPAALLSADAGVKTKSNVAGTSLSLISSHDDALCGIADELENLVPGRRARLRR
jgi:hypothetical protein